MFSLVLLGKSRLSGIFRQRCWLKAEARNLRRRYPDQLAEFWISNAVSRSSAAWRTIEPRLATSGPHQDIFRSSTKYNADRRVLLAVRAAILSELAQRRVELSISCLTYNVRELMAYIAGQFCPGMSWDNYGSEWVIDHIEPRAAFDMRDPIQLLRCWALSNLQPLWIQENNAKGTLDKQIVQKRRR